MSQVLCHLVAGVLTCATFDFQQIVDQQRRQECREAIRMCQAMNAGDPRGECMLQAATRCRDSN